MRKRIPHPLRYSLFLLLLAVLLPPIFCGPASAGGSWTLSATQAGDAAPTQGPSPESAAQHLAAQGLRMQLESGRLTLSGDGGPVQARGVMFDRAAGLPDFIGGAAEILLTLPTDGRPISIALESRPGTGYRWEVLPDEALRVAPAAQSSFSQRSRGFGTAALQTLVFTPPAGAATTIRLIYRRAFEPEEPPRSRLELRLDEPASAIDLSDPAPRSISPSPLAATTPRSSAPPPVKGLPSAFDWRSQGVVPAVRNQGGCGSCWSFGTVGILESAIARSGGPLRDLSEQFLVDCNVDGWGCSGGLTAHHYHQDTLGESQTAIGAVLESVKPYSGTDGFCLGNYAKSFRIAHWIFVPGDEWTVPSVDQIKNAIYTYGPITAGVCVGTAFDGYDSGVFATSESCGGFTNHQIILVGWDDATQTWILRNSWGSGWGESGYMQIRWNTSRVGEGTSWVRPALDVNADGTVNLEDLVILLQVMAGATPVEGIDPAADVDRDGRLGMKEALMALQWVGGVW